MVGAHTTPVSSSCPLCVLKTVHEMVRLFALLGMSEPDTTRPSAGDDHESGRSANDLPSIVGAVLAAVLVLSILVKKRQVR